MHTWPKVGLLSVDGCVSRLGDCFSCRDSSSAVAQAAVSVLAIAPARHSCTHAHTHAMCNADRLCSCAHSSNKNAIPEPGFDINDHEQNVC